MFLAAGSLGWIGCRSTRVEELQRVAPSLSHEFALHLIEDDDVALRAFVLAAGQRATWAALNAISFPPAVTSDQQFERFEAIAGRPGDRLARIAERQWADVASRPWDFYRTYPQRDRMEIARILRAWTDTGAQKMTLEDRERAYRQLLDRAAPYEDVLSLGEMYGVYADLLPRLNRRDEMPRFLELGIQSAKRCNNAVIACQLLGTLGAYHLEDGNEDAMRRCWDEALDLGQRANSSQAARILSFYAVYFYDRGQVALARDLLRQAQERCRELGARDVEIRFLFDSLHLYAGLNCWEVVRRGLQQASVLLDQGRGLWGRSEMELWEGRAQQLRARYCVAVGEKAEAERIAVDLLRRIDAWEIRPSKETAALVAARVLMACGRTVQARALLARAAEQCRMHDMSEMLEDLSLETANACFALGDFPGCRAALDSFRVYAPMSPARNPPLSWLRHDALSVRVAAATSGRSAAIEQLEIALGRLQSQQRQLGASPEAYMALATADELRELAHQLLDDSPQEGYAFEMAWRRSQARPTRTSRSPRAAGHEPDRSGFVHDDLRDAPARLASRNALNCVYQVRDDDIVRWTASAAGVRRDVLPATVSELSARVKSVLASLAKPAAGPGGLDATAASDLRELATALLPDDVLGSRAPRRLLISADGFLSQLPFEALNLAASGYTPLLLHYDVAALRYWEEVGPAGDGPAIVVSRPAYPISLQRRHGILTEDLPLGAAEADLFQRVLPRALALEGAGATKQALCDRWQEARFLYFACHVVQDPEIPFVVFVPMASAPSGRDEDAYLEVTDVRSADLSHCQLVVLSSCASGVAYVNGHAASPSLGEAFMDAGARAVISTAWNVRDDTALLVMREFARAFEGGSADPVAALCEARRKLIRDNAAPYVWAAYSIMLGGL